MSALSIPDLFIIAEIGQAHEGSLGIAHSYVDALAGSGVDAVKFQTHIAQAESSSYEPFRVAFSYEDATRFDYWRRMEFTKEQWEGLKRHCEDVGLIFMSSPFSLAAVALLEEIGCDIYKVGSGEVSNHLLLDRLSATNKPLIISSGMSDLKEIEASVSRLAQSDSLFGLLQCTTAYPTLPHQWALGLIPQLRKQFNCRVGFSDHSGNIYACLGAVALGAQILEFHVCFDQRMFGPDSRASITISQVAMLTEGARQLHESLSCVKSKDDVRDYVALKTIFGKSLAVNRDVKAGESITMDVLETKKPSGFGIPAMNYEFVIGKTLNRDLKAWDFLTESDLTTY